MSFVAVAIGGSAALGLAGGMMQSAAAGRAAQKQADAANHATDIQFQMFNQQRADQEPWRKAGADALSQLGNADFQRDFTSSDFSQDPGYAFRMAEGQKALERSAAARGGLQSGAAMKAIGRYGQDYASNEYQNSYNRFNSDRDRRFNRLSSIAGIGQTANSQIGAAGQNYANQVGQNMMGAANAAAAGQAAQGQIWGNTMSGIGKAGSDYMTMNWMEKQNAARNTAIAAGK